MDRMDEFMESYGWQVPDLTLKPSEYFQRQCYVSFDPGERTAPLLAEMAGPHTLIWASDFPHSDAKFPGVVDELMEHSESMEPNARKGFVGLNALTLYGLPTPAAPYAGTAS
jgi:predicted TIM-barrel fold metal-dependent hydrolase